MKAARLDCTPLFCVFVVSQQIQFRSVHAHFLELIRD